MITLRADGEGWRLDTILTEQQPLQSAMVSDSDSWVRSLRAI